MTILYVMFWITIIISHSIVCTVGCGNLVRAYSSRGGASIVVITFPQ